MKVLAIIVSYNFEPWMEHCLNSLCQSEFPVDVVVIDNASTDQTVHRLKTAYPGIRLIENPGNLGFGQANNQGIRIALEEEYDAVFLINQDAWVAKDTIGTLVELSKEHPQYGILSPVHLTASEKKLDPGFQSYTGIKAKSRLPQHETLVPLDFVNAAFWMIPVSVLRKVGGFSPLFYHYGEDKDFINRLHYHQYLVGYSPQVFGCHDREYRPMEYAKFLRMEYVYHLSELANLNYSGLTAFGFGVLAVLKKVCVSFIKGKSKLAADYGKMFVQLIQQTAKVYCYRKEYLIPQPHFIF